MMRICVCLIYCINLAYLPTAQAAEQGGLVDRLTFRKTDYLKSCEGLLSALQDNEGDAFLLNQAQTPEERAQLLFDYRVLFSQKFLEALLKVLADRGIKYQSRTTRIADFMKQLKGVISMSQAEMRSFADDVLAVIEDLQAAQTSAEVARVAYERTVRLRKALASSQHREDYLDVIGQGIRYVLWATIKEEKVRANDPERMWRYVTTATTLAFAVAVLFWFGQKPGYIITEFSADKIPIQSFHLYGLDNGRATLFGLAIGHFVLRPLATNLFREKFVNYLRTKSPTPVLDKYVFQTILTFALWDNSRDPRPEFYLLDGAQQIPWDQVTPVDLIYLGHVDSQMIKALNNDLMSAVSANIFLDRVQEATMKARTVRENSASYPDQMALVDAVVDLVKLVDGQKISPSNMGQALVERIEKTQNGLEFIRQIPYGHGLAKLSNRQLKMNEFILAVLQTNLASLPKAHFDQQGFLAYLGRIHPSIMRMKNRLSLLPTDPAGWKSAAEDIELLLSEMEMNL